MPEKEQQFQVTAKIYVLSTEEGGRNTPFFKNYSPHFHRIEPDYSVHDVIIRAFADKNQEICFPATLVDVYMDFAYPCFQIGRLWVGQNFYLKEGGRTIASGTITGIFREDFLFWNPINRWKEIKLQGIQPELDVIFHKTRKAFEKMSFTESIYQIKKNDINETQTPFMIEMRLKVKSKNESYYSAKDISQEIFDVWANKLNLGNEKHKFYYLQNESKELIFELFTWDKTFFSCQLIVERPD
ncbi:MAG: hypothetical protein MUF43_07800 [Flavobacterium sp.]|nr:hypothetical protein [Flavobacterium sp.]MCU0392923.1 hypothetical protein [Thermoflexibacter sp.]